MREINTTQAEALRKGGRGYLPAWRKLPRCTNCSRPMRPFRGALADWPATISRATGRACTGCYNRGFRVAGDGARLTEGPTGHMLRKPLPDLSGATRAQRAATWTEEQHSAAWLLCSVARDAADADNAMQMLGLFDAPEEAPVLSAVRKIN